MHPLSDILPGVCQMLDLDGKVHEMAYLALWNAQAERILGKLRADRTEATHFKKHANGSMSLCVAVDHPTLMSELGFFTPQLVAAMNRAGSQTRVYIKKIQWYLRSKKKTP